MLCAVQLGGGADGCILLVACEWLCRQLGDAGNCALLVNGRALCHALADALNNRVVRLSAPLEWC